MELTEFMRLLHIFLNDINPLLQAKGNDSLFLMQCYSSLWHFGSWAVSAGSLCKASCAALLCAQEWPCQAEVPQLTPGGACTSPSCQGSPGHNPPGLSQPRGGGSRAHCARAGLKATLAVAFLSCPGSAVLPLPHPRDSTAESSGCWQQLGMGRLIRNKTGLKSSIC